MKKLLIPIIAVLLLSGCDVANFDDDINQNPNLPTEASGPQLLANAMLSLPDLSSSPTGEYRAQFLAKTIYPEETLYPEGGTSFYWLYQGPLANLQTVIDNSSNTNEVAVAKILKGYYIWHITDRWGDVPYSEALQGVEEFTPVYDTQEVIYDSLFVLFEEAGNQIDTGGSLTNDLMYDGDMQKWVKFSNTVRMLMALRLSEVNETKAQDEFTAALSAGIMESNEDNFVFQHLANANNQNYWYGQVEVSPIREWWALSEGLVELMGPVDDPRLPVYGDTTEAAGGYVGLTYGVQSSVDNADYSLLGDAIHEQDAPVYLTTYAQALFAKAEAAERNWITESVEDNYEAAIENSILQWTGSTDEVGDFLNEPDISFDPGNAMEQIVEQRYVHLFMHGYEAWAEWRRTGYPDNLVTPNGNAIPLRQSYPSDEALNNTDNYDEAVERQFGGDNSIHGSLWWDED